MIQTNPAGLFLTPSYHVMKLYATHSLPVPLAIGSAPQGIDVSACASDDRRRITAFAVNTTGEPVELALDLSELGAVIAVGEVVHDTLDRRQPEVQNHAAAPDRVTTVELPVGRGSVILPAYSASAVECAAV